MSEPCASCPWRRESAKGWLGSDFDAVDWLAVAHSDDTVECHRREGGNPCIGIAVYRANVCKLTRPPNPEAKPDRAAIFAGPTEFHQHHTGTELQPTWVARRYDPAFLARLDKKEDEP